METGVMISLCISAVAILWSLYTYFRHENRLNKQQGELNKYQLARNREEEEEKKKAIIECNIIKSSIKGKSNVLKVYNKGKCSARNINIEIIEGNESELQFYNMHDLIPFPSLLSLHSFEIKYVCFLRANSKYKVKFVWEDDFSNERESVQFVLF